jgi:hypothetical protein
MLRIIHYFCFIIMIYCLSHISLSHAIEPKTDDGHQRNAQSTSLPAIRNTDPYFEESSIGQQLHEASENRIFIQLAGMNLGSVAIIEQEGEWLLPIHALSRLLHFSLEVDPTNRLIQGHTIGQESWMLQLQPNRIIHQHREYQLPTTHYAQQASEFYVALSLLAQTWPVTLQPSFHHRLLTITPSSRLTQLEREEWLKRFPHYEHKLAALTVNQSSNPLASNQATALPLSSLKSADIFQDDRILITQPIVKKHISDEMLELYAARRVGQSTRFRYHHR